MNAGEHLHERHLPAVFAGQGVNAVRINSATPHRIGEEGPNFFTARAGARRLAFQLLVSCGHLFVEE